MGVQTIHRSRAALRITKRAMIRLPAALRDAGLRSRLLRQVHDELLFEAPEHEADRLAELARGAMESPRGWRCRWWWRPARAGPGPRRMRERAFLAACDLARAGPACPLFHSPGEISVC